MALDDALRTRIDSLVRSERVFLVMKGQREAPQCGFSAKVVQMLDTIVPEYGTADALADPELRSGIKEYAEWPTIPQLYVDGEFVGGCDIITELYEQGDLHGALGVEPPTEAVPEIHVTDAAREALQAILENAQRRPGDELRLNVDARFRHGLGFDQTGPRDVSVAVGALTIVFDRDSASRANGLRIDALQSPQGPRFQIDNPNDPNHVKDMSAKELKAILDEGRPLHLFDVRTPEEQAQASIPGARLVDREVATEIESLDRDALIVFHCHHGTRSAAAAEHFRELGFTNLHNLVGGIDAWSTDVDSSVPRY